MRKRAIRIISLSLSIIGLVAADMSAPLTDGVRSGEGLVSADSRAYWASPQRRRRRRRRRRAQPGQLIPEERVREIQRALMEREFLKRATGKYDQSTVRAMKAFQTSENIEVTGYPTAHALDRLGLPLKFGAKPPQPSQSEKTASAGTT